MTCYVIDASVALKWFVPEIHSHSAIRLLDPGNELIAPDLLIAEIGKALWKKFTRNEISAADAKLVLRYFNSAPITLFPSSLIIEIALNLSIERGCSVYDGLYLALAVTRKCRMVTADGKFLNSLKNTSLAGLLVWIEEQ